jgi:hypothetical protein
MALQKLTPRRDPHRAGVRIVDDFEIGTGGKSQSHGKTGEGINALCVAWRRLRHGVDIHNSPCRKGFATSWVDVLSVLQHFCLDPIVPY